MRTKWLVSVGLSLVSCGMLAAPAPQGGLGQGGRGAQGACDRACLEGFVDTYLDAWIARDPRRMPLAPNAKYTENGQRLEFGDGSWNTAKGKGTYRLFVTDASTGQVALVTTVMEDGATPATNLHSMLALRLKIVNRQITEAETIFVRPAANPGGAGARGAAAGAPGATTAKPPPPPPAQRLEAMGVPHALFTTPIPPAERMSREDLIRVANMYFTGMQKNDGQGDYPFTSDCERFENASRSTNVETPPNATRPDPKTASTYSSQWSCLEQFQSGLIHFVTRIRDRRYVAVDPERGLVYSFVFFDHMAGRTRTYVRPADGREITGGPTEIWTWEIAEIFRIEQGKIRRIEAILVRSPYGQQSGWSSYEDSMSDRARDIR
jgi:hypothetical protein